MTRASHKTPDAGPQGLELVKAAGDVVPTHRNPLDILAEWVAMRSESGPRIWGHLADRRELSP